jgi:hypothetical protein
MAQDVKRALFGKMAPNFLHYLFIFLFANEKGRREKEGEWKKEENLSAADTISPVNYNI